MARACIAVARRSPIGRDRGALAGVPADALAAAVMRDVLAAAGARDVDDVLIANTMNAGNVARTAALEAGLPPGTPATTINNQCAGGLTAVRLAAERIVAGRASFVLAGGVESVSRRVIALDGRTGRGDDDALPRVRHAPEGWNEPGMVPAADLVAAELGITRAEQDAYAHESYARAERAHAAGAWERSLVPVGGATRDQLSARPAPRLDRLARYPAAFGAGGTVTAGNCAAAADGAAVALLGSRDRLDAAELRGLGEVTAAAPAAGDPVRPALAVLPAIERALRDAGLAPGDIDLWEINEAFAVKVIAVMRHLGLDRERVNVTGGAIAFGHPFAASGAILLVHLLAALEARGARRGLLALAGAGGVAEAMIIERAEAPP